MKRVAYLSFAALVLLTSFVTFARAQSDSLADYARANRKDKKDTPKKFDNDNLPKTDKLSVVGKPTPEPKEKSAEEASEAQSEPDEKSEAKSEAKTEARPEAESGASGKKPADGDEAKDGQSKNQQWKDKITEQSHKVDLLTREQDVLEREYHLRAAAFYADAGNRLRNQGTWDKEDAQYKQQIADKQKELATAKQDLEDLKEQARKAGIPANMRE
ncbi:MAG: hypothetical protein DMG88_17110 [Acidobacteria bacterium]|nr:MAG: hypothetical protein DMG88_17110 [Acidobacteriota bacterium]